MAYIDKEKIIKVIDKKMGKSGLGFIIADQIKRYINEQPVVKIYETKQGQWIESFKNDCWYYDCPFCDDGFATKERCKT
jgi:hypothetical protein